MRQLRNRGQSSGHELAQLPSGPPDFDIDHHEWQAQHNLAYVAQRWGLAQPPGIVVLGANVDRQARREYVFEVVDVGGRLSAAAHQRLLATRWVQTLAAHQAEGKLRGGATRLMPTRFAPIVTGGVRIDADGRVGKPERALRVAIEPGKPIPIELSYELPRKEVPGWRAFDIVQREAKTRRPIGGARVVVLVLPPEVIDEVHKLHAEASKGARR